MLNVATPVPNLTNRLLLKTVIQSESNRMGRTRHFISRILNKLEMLSGRPWFSLLLAALAFADLFVLVIPLEVILVSSVLLRKRLWWSFALALTLGSAFGAVALALLVRLYGEPLLHTIMHDAFMSPEWLRTVDFVQKHGSLGLAFISLGPLPQQPAVAVCGLAHMGSLKVFLAILLGRAPKYFGVSYLTVRAPQVITKFIRVSKYQK